MPQTGSKLWFLAEKLRISRKKENDLELENKGPDVAENNPIDVRVKK